MPESPNAENRVVLEVLETAAGVMAFDLVTEADIAQIAALCEPQTGPTKTPREGRCE